MTSSAKGSKRSAAEATSSATDVQALSFEEALEELEALSAQLASGQMTLRQSVQAYERGTRLLKRCQEELDSAKATVESLRNDGQPMTAPLES